MSIEALKEQARGHEQREEWRQALDLYVQAIHRTSDDDQPDLGLYNRAGDLNTRLGNLEAAIEYYEKAVELYLDSELPNNAIAILKKILRNVPTRDEVLLQVGQIRAQQGFFTDARESFLAYAELRQRDGDLEEAFRALSEFADLAPDDLQVQYTLVQHLLTHERKQEAIDQLIRAHQRQVAVGRMDRASEVEEKLREIDPAIQIPAADIMSGFETTTFSFTDEQDAEDVEHGFSEIAHDGTEEPLNEIDFERSSEASADASEDHAELEGVSELDAPDELDLEDAADFVHPDGSDTEEMAESAVASHPDHPEPGDPHDPARVEVDQAELGDSDALDLEYLSEPVDASLEYPSDGGYDPIDYEDDASFAGAAEDGDDFAADGSDDDTGDAFATAEGTTSRLDQEPSRDGEVPEEAWIVPSDAVEGVEAATGDLNDETEGEKVDDLLSVETDPIAELDDRDEALEGIERTSYAEELQFDKDTTAADESGLVAGIQEGIEDGDPADELHLVDESADTLSPDEETPWDPSDSESWSWEGSEADADSEAGTVWTPGSGDGLADSVGSGDTSGGWSSANDGERAAVAVADLSVDQLREHLDDRPEDADAWHALAGRLHDEGDPAGATQAWERAHVAYGGRADFERAAEIVHELIAVVPDSVAHHEKLVEYANRGGDAGLQVSAYLMLGQCLERCGEADRAHVVFERVLELEPGNGTALMGLGRGASEVEEPSEAYVDLASMVFEPREKTTRWTVEAEEPATEEDFDFQEMLSQFKAKVAENVDVGDVRAHYDLGTAYREMGLIDEAIGEFQKALRADGKNLATIEMLGQCFMEKGEPQFAVRSLARATEMSWDVEDELLGIYYYLGRAHEELGQRDEAVEFYEKVFALDINFQDVTDRLRSLR
jgi:tetratricopeptide (TPR) repeat protein